MDSSFGKDSEDAMGRDRKQEQLSNPFYLAESDDKVNVENKDIFGNEEHNQNIGKPVSIVKVKNSSKSRDDIVDLIESEPSTTSNKERKKKKHKKHKTLVKKVKVLDDEVIVQPDPPQSNLELKKTMSPSVSSNLHSLKSRNSNSIFLQTKSKLGSFNFKSDETNDLNVIESEQLELEKIKQKFQEQSLEDQQPVADDNDDDEEVIIIKKKKNKSKKKSKNKNKNKNKDKIEEFEGDHEDNNNNEVSETQ